MTLIELILTLGVTSVLLAGVALAMDIATRSLELGTRGVDARTDEAARIIERITNDLRLAIDFDTPLEPDRVNVSVPDLDGDGQADRVIWSWTGPPNRQLLRQVWVSDANVLIPAVVVAEDVRDFDLAYLTRTWGPPPADPLLTSDETWLISHDDVPDGDANRALLVTAGDGPSWDEVARSGLLAWFGYDVDTIAATAPPAEFDAAVAATDVVYVPRTVGAADLGDKVTKAAVGIVNESPDLVAELGLASGTVAMPSVTALEVLVPAHPITAPLGSEPALLFGEAQPCTTLPPDPDQRADGAVELGAWSGVPSLTAVAAGGQLHGPGLPANFGYDTVFSKTSDWSDFDEEHVATRITLTDAAEVHRISAYLAMKRDKELRFGIYADDEGEPGIRLVQTEIIKPPKETTDWYGADVVPPLVLPPGTYWLAIGMQKDVAIHFEHAGGTTRFADSGDNPRDGLADPWIGTYDSNDRRISIRAEGFAVGLASGRRVALPWGDSGFDITKLTSSGRGLMHRAVDWAADPTPDDGSTPSLVGKDRWVAQYFRPELPVNAVSWSTTRIFVAMRSNGDEPDGEVTFSLRFATGAERPGDEIIQETAKIPNTAWDDRGYTWYEIPFAPVEDLNPAFGICLVLEGDQDLDAYVQLDTAGGDPADTHFMTSVNDGGSWSTPNATDDLRFYVFGTYTTQGTPAW